MPDTDIEEWMKRIGVDPNDYYTIREFQAVVREKSYQGRLSAAQLNALSHAFTNLTIVFPKYNVTEKTIKYETRLAQTRYFIPGFRGLFGYQSAVAYVRQQQEL